MRTLAVASMVLALALPAWAAEPRHASLSLASTSPLVVKGRGFGAREHVLLTAATPAGQWAVSVNARRNGTFRARFRLRVDRCLPLTVRALGAGGSHAILQAVPACKGERRKRERERRP